jgi:hypothetical protein
MKPQPDDSGLWNDDLFPRSLDSHLTGWNGTVEETGESKEFKPRYKIGETVYLKEPFNITNPKKPLYKYNGDVIGLYSLNGVEAKEQYWIHEKLMPEKFARYFIKITGVRCERLQDISDEDCLKEKISIVSALGGQIFYECNMNEKTYICQSIKRAYAKFIDHISGKGTWERNPFVWVYDFELVK